MRVRYHVVPRSQTQPAVLIESKEQRVAIRNMSESEAQFTALRQKLADWYSTKHIDVTFATAPGAAVINYLALKPFMTIRWVNITTPAVVASANLSRNWSSGAASY